MALPILLIDLAKRLLLNRWTLLVAVGLAMYATGYLRGQNSVKASQEATALTEAIETAVVQEKIEVAHDKRVRKILSSTIPDKDAATMLSTYPDERDTGK